ncbi:hypothetical protein [Plantactinospora sp. GCM10030261]|uniref:hypothetical protein n=1 Tax=Plantactinospora sp. GCM10030261 TaxID=3273420 RepID=UPI003618AE8D
MATPNARSSPPVTVILAAVLVLLGALQGIIRTIGSPDGTARVAAGVVGILISLAIAYGLWVGNRIAWIAGLIVGGLAILSVFNGDWLSVLAGVLMLVLLLLPPSRAWTSRR